MARLAPTLINAMALFATALLTAAEPEAQETVVAARSVRSARTGELYRFSRAPHGLPLPQGL